MNEFNSSQVLSTLKQVLRILETNNIEYRFLGSVVIAGLNGKLHRNLGDLDLIIDARGKKTLYDELKSLGFTQAGSMFTFARKYLSLETLEHSEYLEVGYFCGTWQTDESFMMGNKRFNLSVEGKALQKTKYELYGVEFFGIPPRAAATGVAASKTNPKRQKERILLKEKGIQPFANDYIHIKIFGMGADWIYHFSMGVLNLVGDIRVRLGMTFDPWR